MECSVNDNCKAIEQDFVFYRLAFDFKNDDANGYNSLGIWLGKQGKLADAAAAHRRAIRIDPEHAAAYQNLGFVLAAQGERAGALRSFQQASRLAPDNLTARHMIAALSGTKPSSPPSQFITQLFDRYATTFERHLEKCLGYNAPAKLRKLLDGCIGPTMHFQKTIDLGCGTGLSGIHFREISAHLVGVDLSAKMVMKAREKGIYDFLHVDDLNSYLNHTKDQYNLFIAADVLVYLGELTGVFSEIKRCAAPDAFFLCSTESCAGNDFILRETGRYAHSRSYLQSMAIEHGFSVFYVSETGIRKENRKWIKGDLFVLQNSADKKPTTSSSCSDSTMYS